jgi:pimeloyl-ACP methyl ester carboxylesterase
VVLSTRVLGEGRPIVLLPWFSLDSAVMATAFEPVFAAGSGWRRIYLDLPGTGGSRPVAPTSDAVLDAVADTVETIVGAEPYVLAGCSYGGYLAAGLTRRAPEQVAGLLLVCSGVRIRPEQRNLAGAGASTPQQGWLDLVPAELHGHFEHAVGLQTQDVGRRMTEAFAVNGATDDEYLTALRATGYPLSDEDSDVSSSTPFGGNVMMLTGRQDRVAGYRDQLDALARYSRGDYVLMNDAGHYLPIEAPERFTACTRDWLARL